MQVFYYHTRRSKNEVEAAMRTAAEQRDLALKKAKEEEIRNRHMSGEKARLAAKAAKYFAAEATHAFGGPAPAAVFEERMRLCLACPGRVDVLEGMTDDGGVGFCTKCGCGANQRSKLSVKLTLAGVDCPLGKFGKVEGTGATLNSAVEAAKGIISTVGGEILKAVKKVGE